MATTTFTYNANEDAPFHPKAIVSDLELCSVCGRILGKNPWYMEVIDGGYIRLQDGTEPVRDGGYMGHYPIGTECAKKFAPNLLKKMEG